MRADGHWRYSDRLRKRLKGLDRGGRAHVYLVQGRNAERGLVATINLTGPAEHVPGADPFSQEFPWRMPIKIHRERTEPVDLKPLVQDLDSFANKVQWGSYLQGRPFFQLTEKDFDVVRRSLVPRPSAPDADA